MKHLTASSPDVEMFDDNGDSWFLAPNTEFPCFLKNAFDTDDMPDFKSVLDQALDAGDVELVKSLSKHL